MLCKIILFLFSHVPSPPAQPSQRYTFTFHGFYSYYAFSTVSFFSLPLPTAFVSSQLHSSVPWKPRNSAGSPASNVGRPVIKVSMIFPLKIREKMKLVTIENASRVALDRIESREQFESASQPAEYSKRRDTTELQ